MIKDAQILGDRIEDLGQVCRGEEVDAIDQTENSAERVQLGAVVQKVQIRDAEDRAVDGSRDWGGGGQSWGDAGCEVDLERDLGDLDVLGCLSKEVEDWGKVKQPKTGGAKLCGVLSLMCSQTSPGTKCQARCKASAKAERAGDAR